MKRYPQIIVFMYRKWKPKEWNILQKRSVLFCDIFYVGHQYLECMVLSCSLIVMNWKEFQERNAKVAYIKLSLCLIN
jgi:hypothetical protein